MPKKTKAKSSRTELVPLEQVTLAETYKVRECNLETVKRYAEQIQCWQEQLQEWKKNGSDGEEPPYPFPPAKVIELEYEDGIEYECVTGNHAVEAARHANLEDIEIEIVGGDELELLTLAIADNTRHGLPFTKEELEANVVLLHKKGKLAYRKIADIVGLSKSSVGNIIQQSKDGRFEDQDLEKRAAKNFDPTASLEKLWRPFEKHPESFTETMIPQYVQAISELHGFLDQNGCGDLFLDQIEEEFWTTQNEDSEEDSEDYVLEESDEEENFDEEEEEEDDYE